MPVGTASSVSNIEKIVKHCGDELHTHVMDWSEMRDLQLAYLRAGVANQDVPQDHAFFASLYHYATRNGIRTVLSGGNIATEGIFPKAWHGSAMDAINLRAIHHRYGTIPLKHYQAISFGQHYFWYPLVKRMKVLRLLNFMPYNKSAAITELESIGWRSYVGKHGESLFTRFFQNYWLPTKFGYDKRRPHLSSLIVSGSSRVRPPCASSRSRCSHRPSGTQISRISARSWASLAPSLIRCWPGPPAITGTFPTGIAATPE